MLLVDEVLSRIAPGDRILDVGGWACPFNRADWVLDCEPYETHGYYETIGLPKSQGGEREHFARETRVRRDICEKTPWPSPDNWFDFAICSRTLEDIRDPLFVCSELNRVSRRGNIGKPSRVVETCRGWESDRIAGLSRTRQWIGKLSNDAGPSRKISSGLVVPPSGSRKSQREEAHPRRREPIHPNTPEPSR